MGKCVKCGNALGIFSAKHKLKDGFACSACFEEIKVENTKIMKDCINKYLLNNLQKNLQSEIRCQKKRRKSFCSIRMYFCMIQCHFILLAIQLLRFR